MEFAVDFAGAQLGVQTDGGRGASGAVQTWPVDRIVADQIAVLDARISQGRRGVASAGQTWQAHQNDVAAAQIDVGR